MNKNGDFIYTEVFGGVIITKYIGTDENVAIPEKINGKPVIYIDSSIFCNVAGILKSVEIYANITSIISGTFKNCTSLQSVDIPKSVKSISDDAFDGCDNIKINISAEIQIGKFLINPKFNSNVLTADKKNINSDTKKFTPKNHFRYSIIADYVVIEKYLGSDSLVIIPAKIEGFPVKNIEKEAFRECKTPEEIEIPDSVIKIGDFAFSGCYHLKSINIPESVAEICDNAFSFCESLEEVNIPNSVTEIGELEIGEFAFGDCESIKSINIPDSVIKISDWTFSGCMLLKSINIPDSVTIIGNFAFFACSSLETIEIPNSVTEIGEKAFSGCKSLKNIKISRKTKIAEDTFENCPAKIIYRN